MIRLLPLVLLLVTGVASADGVFKCTDASGSISYQQNPCAAGSDVDTVKVENTPDPSYVAPTYPKYGMPQESVSERVEEARRNYNDRRNEILDEYYEEKCERYKGYLQAAEDRWDRVRRKGYKQSEKDHYEGLIQERERQMKAACS